MKRAKAPKVPVLESAFEVNLPKIRRAVRASGSPTVVLVDGAERTVAVLSNSRLAVHLGGRVWMADIVAVQCLNDRVRPLLKCPRAHEGNFQSLYFRAGELACRHCHVLRYRSTLAATAVDRARLAHHKLLDRIGGVPGDTIPARPPGVWRKRYQRVVGRLVTLTGLHHGQISRWLDNARNRSPLPPTTAVKSGR